MTTRNPLKFTCAPNEATPDYVSYSDFQKWLAFGFVVCWLSHDPNDPNADSNMERPVTVEDVKELRGYFLDIVETAIVAYWTGEIEPGSGWVDQETKHLHIYAEGEMPEEFGENETVLSWRVRFDDDSMMFSLDCTGSDEECIWLNYDALGNRKDIVKALVEANAINGSEVWDKLIAESKHDLDWDEILVSVKDLEEGDKVDLESCPYLNDHQMAEFEYAEVVSVVKETDTTYAVGYEGIDLVGYDPNTKLKIKRRQHVHNDDEVG